MPNHCANQLRITGTKQDLADFREVAKGSGPDWDRKGDRDNSELDLNQFMPVPESVLTASRTEKGHTYDAYNSGGYEWVIKHWGTKWGCYDIDVIEESDSELTYRFQTAWSPFNEAVTEAMSKRFPELEFELKYAEQGCGFIGRRTATNGEITDDECQNMPSGLAGDSDIIELYAQSG